MSTTDIYVFTLELSETNEAIQDFMHTMKSLREIQKDALIVCSIYGFDEDPRELHEIPEVRGFCRRLVSVGFISYLDYASTLLPEERQTAPGLGAFEVWACGEGIMRNGLEFTENLSARFNLVLRRANAAADKTCGLFQRKTKER
jgi:hypothetical protein